MYKFGFTREGSRAALAAVGRGDVWFYPRMGFVAAPAVFVPEKNHSYFLPEEAGRTSSLTTSQKIGKRKQVEVNGVHAPWISDGHRPDEGLHLRDGQLEESERCCASENVFVLISGLPDRRALQDTERRDSEDFTRRSSIFVDHTA